MLKNICMLAAIAAVYFLCAGCGGTVRAISGDYDSDAPEVEAIAPRAGSSGEEVTFEAKFCEQAGSPGAKYEWHFGGGADPNISFEETPTVNLTVGRDEPYECQLIIKGNCTGEDENKVSTTDFTLQVLPLEIAYLGPSTVTAGSAATFTVILESGVATTYFWDFGGGANPGSSTGSSPTVQISTRDGIYNGYVIVANAYEAIRYDFNYSVLPAAQ